MKKEPYRPKPAKLDKTKPYGEIHGRSRAKYEQNGKKFDFHGNEIIEAK